MTEWEEIGTISVDSGQMMFADPCYVLDDKEYRDMLRWREKQGNTQPVKYKGGIVSNTGFGDGRYHVYVKKDEMGRVLEMKIRFDVTYMDVDDHQEDMDMKELGEKLFDKQ